METLTDKERSELKKVQVGLSLLGMKLQNQAPPGHVDYINKSNAGQCATAYATRLGVLLEKLRSTP